MSVTKSKEILGLQDVSRKVWVLEHEVTASISCVHVLETNDVSVGGQVFIQLYRRKLLM